MFPESHDTVSQYFNIRDEDVFEPNLEEELKRLRRLEVEAHRSIQRLLQERHHQLDHTPPALSLLRHAQRLFRQSTLTPSRIPERKGNLLDAEIYRERQRLSWITHQREGAATKLARLQRAPVSACHQLPPELWSLIFQFCLTEGETYVCPNIHVAPLLLGRVCRFWREVSISTPSLWVSLSISRNWRKRPHPFLLQQWIQRGQTLPLSLDVSLISPLKAHAHSYHDYAILQMVVACSVRWQRLRLGVSDDYLLQALLDTPMPLLHTLEFSSNCAIGDLAVCPTLAPNLRTVSLLTAPLDLMALTLPWNQLTEVSSRYWTDVDSHLEVMRRCPNLQSIRLHILHAHHKAAPPRPPLLMTHLKSLEVVAMNGEAMALILNRLTLPSICKLRLTVPEESPEYGVSGWPKDSVIALIDRSACRTLKVHLDGIDISVTGAYGPS